MKSALLASLWGALFGVGLALSGMVQPAKVLAFLDLAGAWDPSLMFVMAGAFGVFAVLRALVLRRQRSLLGASFPPKPSTTLDGKLLAGAALFGVGWGLAGYCPGPAVVAAGSGSVKAAVVVIAMVVGMRAADWAFGLRANDSEVGSAGEACS